MRQMLRTGTGAILVVMIMTIGSLVLWIGTPLLWLWVGSQIEGATASLGGALGATFIGRALTIVVLAGLLSKLSAPYRSHVAPPGPHAPRPLLPAAVLVLTAGL